MKLMGMVAYRYAVQKPRRGELAVFHLGPKKQTVLHTPPGTLKGKTDTGRPPLAPLLAKGMVWFHTQPVGSVWADKIGGNALIKGEEAYWIPAASLKTTSARVTNDYYNLWWDQEAALLDVKLRMERLRVASVKELLMRDPEFLFCDSMREGVVTGRAWRNRARFCRHTGAARRRGASLEQAMDEQNAIRYENPITKDAFRLDMCELQTKADVDAVWRKMERGWIAKNTGLFSFSKFDMYLAWAKAILVPGPIPVA